MQQSRTPGSSIPEQVCNWRLSAPCRFQDAVREGPAWLRYGQAVSSLSLPSLSRLWPKRRWSMAVLFPHYSVTWTLHIKHHTDDSSSKWRTVGISSLSANALHKWHITVSNNVWKKGLHVLSFIILKGNLFYFSGMAAQYLPYGWICRCIIECYMWLCVAPEACKNGSFVTQMFFALSIVSSVSAYGHWYP